MGLLMLDGISGSYEPYLDHSHSSFRQQGGWNADPNVSKCLSWD